MEGFADAFASGLRVHACAVAFCVQSADETPFVEGEMGQAGEGLSECCCLIKAALALALRVKRDGHDTRRALERRALLRFVK